MNQVVYGFHTVQERFGDTVLSVGEEVVNTLITQSFAEHNAQLSALTRLFVRGGITDPTRTFKVPRTTRNQPLDEFGRPLPIKAAGQYSVGFPYDDSGNAIGWTWLKAQKATVEDLNNAIATIQDGDVSYVFDHILAALFNNANRTFWDEDKGSITVLPIANGDSQVYMVRQGAFAGSTDNHLLAQANAIDDGADNPFPAIYNELREHPENGNGGRIITFVATNLVESIKGLATFFPPTLADLSPGSGSTVLTGTLGVDVPGDILGMESSGTWVVEWPRIPSGYMISLATGGEPPIGERIDPDLPGGLFETDTNEDYPWYQRNWMRRVGYGAWNRVGAVVTRIGNGSYAVPTGYGTVMY